MVRQTRISLRQLLLLVAYVAVVLYLIVPREGEGTFFRSLTWVYHFGSGIRNEPFVWTYLVVGILLLLGTLPPFFLVRWWTITAALVCAALYVLIGFEGVRYNFVL
jgi:hypothetical protein